MHSPSKLTFAALLLVSACSGAANNSNRPREDLPNSPEVTQRVPAEVRDFYENVDRNLPPSTPISPPTPTNGEAVAAMAQGQAAPFNGVLLNGAATAALQAQAQAQRSRAELERVSAGRFVAVRALRDLENAGSNAAANEQICRIRLSGQETEIGALHTRISTLESQSQLRLWLGVGAFAVGVFGTVLVYSLVNQ